MVSVNRMVKCRTWSLGQFGTITEFNVKRTGLFPQITHTKSYKRRILQIPLCPEILQFSTKINRWFFGNSMFIKSIELLKYSIIINFLRIKPFNPQAPAVQKTADELVFRRFEGEGVEFFLILTDLTDPHLIFDAHLLEKTN